MTLCKTMLSIKLISSKVNNPNINEFNTLNA